MIRPRIAFIAILTTLSLTVRAPADEPAKPGKQKRDVWMRVKLKSTQAIFDGLMHSDFAAVNKKRSSNARCWNPREVAARQLVRQLV